jgi:hypothetical protein
MYSVAVAKDCLQSLQLADIFSPLVLSLIPMISMVFISSDSRSSFGKSSRTPALATRVRYPPPTVFPCVHGIGALRPSSKKIELLSFTLHLGELHAEL